MQHTEIKHTYPSVAYTDQSCIQGLKGDHLEGFCITTQFMHAKSACISACAHIYSQIACTQARHTLACISHIRRAVGTICRTSLPLLRMYPSWSNVELSKTATPPSAIPTHMVLPLHNMFVTRNVQCTV